MIETVINLISERQAIAAVNEWLVSYVGDRFLAGDPALDAAADLWRVPIQYVYPREGPIGDVGEITLDALTGELREHPSIEEIKRQALTLYQIRCGINDASLPATGN